MSRSLRTLKGVGEKTEKLLHKAGIADVEGLLRYYPRNYDVYEMPENIADLEEGTVKAVSAAVSSGVYMNTAGRLKVITVTVSDKSGRLNVVWFNAPYLRSMMKKGSVFVFRGRVVRKNGKLELEHPEIFTPAAYEEVLHNMQPVYRLTAGLTNKALTKLVRQTLEDRSLQTEYLPDEIRERYQLADINFSLRAIHFPGNMEELLTARKRLVFDEFLLFILSVQLLKEKTEEAENHFPMKMTWTTEEVIERLPYNLTRAQMNTWHEIERDLA